MKIWLVAENCDDDYDFIIGIFNTKEKAIEAATNYYNNCDEGKKYPNRARPLLERDGYVQSACVEGWQVSISEHSVY